MFVDHEADEAAWRKTATDLGSGPSGVTGHFVYDKDQMHAIAQEWEKLAQSYADSMAGTTSMTVVEGPGAEYASKSHAVDANRSGEVYVQSLDNCRRYCADQVAKYKKALGEVVEADDESHKKLQQPSSSPLDGGI